MRHLLMLWVGLSLTLAAGCSRVILDKPFGEPAEIEEKTWNGYWVSDGGVVTIKVKEPKAGLMTAAWIEDEKDTLTLKTAEIAARKQGDQDQFLLFYHLKNDEKEELNGKWQMLGLSKLDKKNVIVWGPNENEFKKGVEKGTIKGVKRGDDILLEAMNADQATSISQGMQYFAGRIRWC